MDIKELTNLFINYTEKLEEESLTLFQFENFLDKHNVYYHHTINVTINDLDCYLFILLNDTWYFATGAPYFDNGTISLNFTFVIESTTFYELRQKDIDDLRNNLNTFREDTENSLKILEDPNAKQKITLQKIFASIE